jgi:multiple sugar transport system permease protein
MTLQGQRKLRRSLRRIPWYLVWIVVTVVTLFPLYWLVLVSSRSRIELFTEKSLIQTTFYEENFVRPLLQDIYGQYLLNSVFIALGNTVLVTVVALLGVYALSRYRLRGADSIFFWTITNRMAPPAAFMLPLFLIYTKIFAFPDGWSLYDTHIGLILAYCVFNLPFAMWLLKGIVDNIPTDIDDAARVDGMTTLGIVFRIIMPLAGPAIATVALLSWLFSWNEFLFAATLSSVTARTITTGLAEFVTITGTNWGEMAAMAVVAILPAVFFLGLVQKYLVAGMTFGAVRE